MKKVENISTNSVELQNELNSANTDNLTAENVEIKKKKLKIKRKKHRPTQAQAVRYDVATNKGLTTEIVESRIIDGLTNLVSTKYTKSILSIFTSNIFTFFNLLCALVITAYVVVGTGIANFTFVIPFAINLAIGIIQEIRAKISIEKLSILQAPTTIVVRDGEEYSIPSNDIVLDDVFKIQTGNQIPVDGIVLEGYVEVNESLLTGESVAVKKNKGDTIMAGSFVTGGSCYAKADSVGDECYVQKLTAKAKRFKKPRSELMTTLNWIVKIVGLLIIPIALGIGLVNYTHTESETYRIIEMIRFIVERTGSVIIGMIPAGLILLTTMALSLGVIRLHKRNTLVQDMYSLEMLARIDVLCLDKTGTITDGRMKVLKDVPLTERHQLDLSDIIGTMEKILDDSNQTAVALRAHYIPKNELSAVKILPFSSERKYSAVTFAGYGTYALGAPEFIIPDLPESIKMQIDQYTFAGNRVLMLAHSTANISSKQQLPVTMKPISLIVLTDNIRNEAIETIKWFKDNDVNVKVISGDNPITVSEIAKRAGIEHASNWISLEGLSDKEVASVADRYTVFGRVTPDQKALLIKSMKRSGHTVAMTGDGVNDILAMRESDCSITVASGADSAKNVAHIVLVDNNFNSMPNVVSEGRRVINNIQQSASLFLMKTLFITLLALLSIVSVKSFPFSSGMLTMLELLIIGFPSFVLSLQPNDKRVEGDFLSTIISNAIPGALILLSNVYIVKFLATFGIFPSENFSITVQVVIFTFGGLVYLSKICRPYNVLRGVLVAIISGILAVWVIFLLDSTEIFGMNFFGLENIFKIEGKESWPYIVLIVAIIELDFPLLNIFVRLNKYLTSTFNSAHNQSVKK